MQSCVWAEIISDMGDNSETGGEPPASTAEAVVENKIGLLGPPRGYFGTVSSMGVQKMVMYLLCSEQLCSDYWCLGFHTSLRIAA